MRKLELLFIKYCGDNQLEKAQAYLTLAKDAELDINAVDEDGLTAAYWAVQEEHTEVIRILAATGQVDWNKGDPYRCTPLHLALGWGKFEVARIIVKQGNINFSLQTHHGETVAMAAVAGGSALCVNLLAEQENCDSWNIPDNDGDTPLMVALRRRRVSWPVC